MSNTDRHRNSATNHATLNHDPPPKRHPKLLSIFLHFTIMFLIFSLFLIFLTLAAILLINLLLARSVVNRRRRHHHTTALHHHLPTFQYATTATTSDDDCSICLESFKERDLCRVLPVCDHFFHAQCVDSWLTEVLNCPVCRTPVRPGVDRPADSVVGDDESKFMWAIGVGRQVVVNC